MRSSRELQKEGQTTYGLVVSQGRRDRPHAVQQGVREGEIGYQCRIARPKRSDPQRPKRPSATARTIDVKIVGTPPVRGNLCTQQLAVSAAVRNRGTKTIQYNTIQYNTTLLMLRKEIETSCAIFKLLLWATEFSGLGRRGNSVVCL